MLLIDHLRCLNIPLIPSCQEVCINSNNEIGNVKGVHPSAECKGKTTIVSKFLLTTLLN
jgi:hypothetical protein